MNAAALKSGITRQPWRLWAVQLFTIIRLDLRRNLLTWRGLWVYFLAFAPTVVMILHALVERHSHSMNEDMKVFAGIFQYYYCRLAIFFGALGIFTRLIRGEMVERSLHYYLLAPIRREVLLIGKFLAGTIRALLIFESAIYIGFMVMHLHFGRAGEQFVFDGPGMAQLISYMTITALACVAYGALFLLFSMLLKNPTPLALLLMLWEVLSSILPSFLQRFSVASYIRQLLPISIPGEGIFALLSVNVEPVPPAAAITGVMILTVAIVTISCFLMRKLEISYTTD
jgi:hypothetical protein